MNDLFPFDEHGELAWVRVELDLLGPDLPLAPSETKRRDELVRRERALLRLDERTPA